MHGIYLEAGMRKYVVEKYILLISDFVYERLSVEDFEKYYLKMATDESYIIGGEIAEIISGLFCDIDSYCGDPTIADYDSINPFCDIDETELRRRATAALEKLKALQAVL